MNAAWRTVFRIGFPLARLCWLVLRPRHRGALVAIRVGQAVLLVRASYRRDWNFPGGGVKRDETPEAAAIRELGEEIGLITRSLLPAGMVQGVWDGRHDQVHLFELCFDRLPKLRLDNREIVEARLVPVDALHGMKLTGPVAAYLAGLPPPRERNTP